MGFLFRLPWDAWCHTATFDHAKSAKDLAKMGVDIYSSTGTLDEIGLSGHHRANVVCHAVNHSVGRDWWIAPFNLVHDSAEPTGFLISSKGDAVTFITDTAYCEYVLPPCNILMIEANYSETILAANVDAGRIEPARAKRVLQNHMSLERVLDFLAANDTSRLREIRLLHLSDGNSDAKEFRKTVQKATGIPVFVEG